MPKIARCPLCGKEPDVWCRDEEWRIRITCCRHVVYSTEGWNRYVAAMELRERVAWMLECNDCPLKNKTDAQKWGFGAIWESRRAARKAVEELL